MSKPGPRLIDRDTLYEEVKAHYERETDLQDHSQGQDIAMMQVCAMMEDDIAAGDAVVEDEPLRATIRNQSNGWRGDEKAALDASQEVAGDIRELLKVHPLVKSGDVSVMVRARSMAGIMNACDAEVQACSPRQYMGMLAAAVSDFLRDAEAGELLMFWEMVSNFMPQDGKSPISPADAIRAIYSNRADQ